MNARACVAIAIVHILVAAPVVAVEKYAYGCFLRSDFSQVCFNLEVADTTATRSRGLMHRDYMPARQGMVFDFFEASKIGMWMKNTFIPLDMVFLDEQATVVHIHHHAVPQSLEVIRSPSPVRYTVELNAGTAKRYGLETGQRLIIRPNDYQ
ncbi:MAG: DUF192 domain-containing protein [Pseudomonadota bacterium]